MIQSFVWSAALRLQSGYRFSPDWLFTAAIEIFFVFHSLSHLVHMNLRLFDKQTMFYVGKVGGGVVGYDGVDINLTT